MKWFRFYTEVLDDPKIQRMPANLRWQWVKLLCLANLGTPRGRLPSTQDIAYRLRITREQADTLVVSLSHRGLIDEIDGRYVPHNWDVRQPTYDLSTQRVKSYREKAQRNVAETFQKQADTDTEEDTEQEPEKETDYQLLQLRPNIFHLYAQTFGPVTQRVREMLEVIEKEHPPEWIEAAFNEAAMNGARSLRYVETILRRWEHEERQEEAANLRRAEEQDAIEEERARLRAERKAREKDA